MKGIKNVRGSLEKIDGTQGTRDVSADIKLNKDGSSATLALKETQVGKYRLVANVDDHLLQSHITVIDTI